MPTNHKKLKKKILVQESIFMQNFPPLQYLYATLI